MSGDTPKTGGSNRARSSRSPRPTNKPTPNGATNGEIKADPTTNPEGSGSEISLAAVVAASQDLDAPGDTSSSLAIAPPSPPQAISPSDISPSAPPKKSMTDSTALTPSNSGSELVTGSTVNVAGVRPIAASPVEVLDTVNMAGMRPIIASGLAVQGTVNVAGIRPIINDGFQAVQEINIMGIRPIGASQIQIAETVSMMGMRPIAYSGLNITEMMSVAGLRPIASNDIDDSATLMGFLD